MITANLTASNREDWTIQFSATDEDTGNDIDFTGANIDFKLTDVSGCVCIEASTTGGTITLPDPTIVEIAITEAQMHALCAGSYPFGCVYELNDTKVQLFTGNATIYDGIASI